MSKWIQISVVSDEEPSPAGDETAPAARSSGPGRLLVVGGGLVVLGLLVVAVWFFALRGGDQPATAGVIQPPGAAVPMPASQLLNPAASVTASSTPSGGVTTASEPGADPTPAEVAQRLTPEKGVAVVNGDSTTEAAPEREADSAPSGDAATTKEPSTDQTSAEVARRLTSEKRVAVVNGEPITEAALEREVGIGRVLYPLLKGIPVGNDAQTLEQMRSDLLSSLIDERLLVQAAEEAGLTVSEADLDARVERMLGRVGLSIDDFADQLSTVGVSMDDLHASLKSTMLAERFVSENPPPGDVSGKSTYEAWVKALQKQGDIQILTGDSASKTVKMGQPAPDFTLRGPSGETVRLTDFAGQPLLVNFWATWCPPCRLEMPLLEQTYEKLKDNGLVVLAVDVQEGPELANPYIAEMGLTFPVALDRAGAVASAYRVTGLPTSVFVDANGIVTDIHRGALVESTLQGYLDEILP